MLKMATKLLKKGHYSELSGKKTESGTSGVEFRFEVRKTLLLRNENFKTSGNQSRTFFLCTFIPIMNPSKIS